MIKNLENFSGVTKLTKTAQSVIKGGDGPTPIEDPCGGTGGRIRYNTTQAQCQTLYQGVYLGNGECMICY